MKKPSKKDMSQEKPAKNRAPEKEPDSTDKDEDMEMEHEEGKIPHVAVIIMRAISKAVSKENKPSEPKDKPKAK